MIAPTTAKTSVFSDTFNRANENPLNPATWNGSAFPLQIISDAATSVNQTSIFAGYQNPIAVYSKNQYASVLFHKGTTSHFSYIGLYLLTDTVNTGIPVNGISVLIGPAGTGLQIDAFIASVQNNIHTDTNFPIPTKPFTLTVGIYEGIIYVYLNNSIVFRGDISSFTSQLSGTNIFQFVSIDSVDGDTDVQNFDSGNFSAPESFMIESYDDGFCNIIERWLFSNRSTANESGIFAYDLPYFSRRVTVPTS